MNRAAFILSIIILGACSSSKNSVSTPKPEVNPELLSARAKVPGITLQELADGKKLFVERCSNCHALKNPSDYTPQQWDPILVRMTMKAHISDEGQKLLIRNYLVANSK